MGRSDPPGARAPVEVEGGVGEATGADVAIGVAEATGVADTDAVGEATGAAATTCLAVAELPGAKPAEVTAVVVAV